MISVLATIETIENDEDRAFVARLYGKYKKLALWEIQQKIGDFSVAEDIMQEAFVRIIKHLDTVKGLSDETARHYLMRTVDNVCYDYLEKKAKTEKKEIPMDLGAEMHPASEDYDPEKIFLRREQQSMLQEVVKKLDERDQKLLLCRYVYGMSQRETAEFIGMDEKNVSVYLARAKRKLVKLAQKEM